ncbi:hypothetical protein HBI56_079670 [Parastagonospora nodorum]|nr:hypothetical protein HBH74_042900 [Parastagonospora nodorum]KAH5192864.1 hypothetical protein HBH77_149580 [Parastagonospora nodorum]KAH5705714.1 hypothetical protein HBI20_228820 [Parastagonospora nodorum]KAH5985662.1 hypothetical protein HBI84_223360 [Parastagonospora nodorum]KAH6020256.1 hypothetical protein HBI82_085870 [Parastagonospora nodorum]
MRSRSSWRRNPDLLAAYRSSLYRPNRLILPALMLQRKRDVAASKLICKENILVVVQTTLLIHASVRYNKTSQSNSQLCLIYLFYTSVYMQRSHLLLLQLETPPTFSRKDAQKVRYLKATETKVHRWNLSQYDFGKHIVIECPSANTANPVSSEA